MLAVIAFLTTLAQANFTHRQATYVAGSKPGTWELGPKQLDSVQKDCIKQMFRKVEAIHTQSWAELKLIQTIYVVLFDHKKSGGPQQFVQPKLQVCWDEAHHTLVAQTHLFDHRTCVSGESAAFVRAIKSRTPCPPDATSRPMLAAKAQNVKKINK